MGSSLYIFLKRFYLKELLAYFLWAFFGSIGAFLGTLATFLEQAALIDLQSPEVASHWTSGIGQVYY
jgi:hypothetical protein